MAALQIAEHLRLTPLHAQQVGGARHVDVEEGAAHQEVGGFRRHVLGELRQPLRRDDAGKAALAAPAHQVGHRAQRHLARFVRNFAGGGGREHLRLVHHHQHRVPEVAVGIEQPAQEGGGVAHLKLDVQPFQVDDDRNPVLAHTCRDSLKRSFGMGGGVDHHMAELLGQRHEIALGIEDRLLHPGSALLDQPAQQVRLAGTGISLHQQAGRQQLFQIERRRSTVLRRPHVDADFHHLSSAPSRLNAPPRISCPLLYPKTAASQNGDGSTASATRRSMGLVDMI